MQTAKSIGMGIGSLQPPVGPDATTGITSNAAGSIIIHLDIPVSIDPDAAARSLYTDILQRLDKRIARWSGFWFSLLGRAHVAKQVLVSMIPIFLFGGMEEAYMSINHRQSQASQQS